MDKRGQQWNRNIQIRLPPIILWIKLVLKNLLFSTKSYYFYSLLFFCEDFVFKVKKNLKLFFAQKWVICVCKNGGQIMFCLFFINVYVYVNIFLYKAIIVCIIPHLQNKTGHGSFAEACKPRFFLIYEKWYSSHKVIEYLGYEEEKKF